MYAPPSHSLHTHTQHTHKQTTGLGIYKSERLTENKYREEWSYPIRTTYHVKSKYYMKNLPLKQTDDEGNVVMGNVKMMIENQDGCFNEWTETNDWTMGTESEDKDIVRYILDRCLNLKELDRESEEESEEILERKQVIVFNILELVDNYFALRNAHKYVSGDGYRRYQELALARNDRIDESRKLVTWYVKHGERISNFLHDADKLKALREDTETMEKFCVWKELEDDRETCESLYLSTLQNAIHHAEYSAELLSEQLSSGGAEEKEHKMLRFRRALIEAI